jgi:choline dehydrogenase-like flavoprotein
VNPTLTIVANALRVADKIKERLGVNAPRLF